MTGRQVDRICVVDAPAAGEPFPFVVPIEGDEIRDLFTLRIDHTEKIPAVQLKGGAGLRGETLALTLLGGGRGHG